MDDMFANFLDDVTVFGNTLLGLATFTWADGTEETGGVGGVRDLPRDFSSTVD